MCYMFKIESVCSSGWTVSRMESMCNVFGMEYPGWSHKMCSGWNLGPVCSGWSQWMDSVCSVFRMESVVFRIGWIRIGCVCVMYSYA